MKFVLAAVSACLVQCAAAATNAPSPVDVRPPLPIGCGSIISAYLDGVAMTRAFGVSVGEAAAPAQVEILERAEAAIEASGVDPQSNAAMDAVSAQSFCVKEAMRIRVELPALAAKRSELAAERTKRVGEAANLASVIRESAKIKY